MKLIDYIDPERATKELLYDWNDQHWKADNGKAHLNAICAEMTRCAGASCGMTPTHGGGSGAQARLCAAIDRKDAAAHGYRQALSYLREIEPCWARLTEDEQFLLTARFIDRVEGRGIERIMQRLGVGRSEAYNRSNAALKRLSGLLFW